MGVADPRNTLLSYMHYHTKLVRSRPNCMGVGRGPKRGIADPVEASLPLTTTRVTLPNVVVQGLMVQEQLQRSARKI